ncbi:MAG TPA: hypothetical protein PKM78_15985 [Anaerolineae bacterium]|nr:hypothetical protein [Anaerolineae bacterium]HNU05614.1 hypothetical protein [Anaerolineae bacterium]
MESRFLGDGRRVRYLNCDLEEERRAINTSRFFLGWPSP